MRVLVTGATGFIGRHLVRGLLSSGYRVRALVREAGRAGEMESVGAELVVGDITRPRTLAAAVEGCETCCHLAALLGAWGRKIAQLRRVNVEGTRNVLEACRRAGVRRMVHISTPGVVGIRGLAEATESDPPHPTGPYERSKWEAEELVRAARLPGIFEVVILRPDFVYGPGDLRRLELFDRIQRGRFRLVGDGSARIRPTYVGDVIAGILLALEHPKAGGEVFNIAGPRVVSWRELVEGIARALGVTPPGRGVPVWMGWLAAFLSAPPARLLRRPPLVTFSRVRFLTVDHGTSITKARKVLGYQPRVDLEEGLTRTVAWYREMGLLPPAPAHRLSAFSQSGRGQGGG